MSVMYTFRGNLVLTGALHIGSGSGNATTDATIMRDAQGRPYIPGSSLRGAFRTAVERLAPTLLGEPPAREMDELEDALRPLIEEKSEATVQYYLNETLNTIERLFGTTYWASPLIIPDLKLVAENASDVVQTEIRHGVGIDRDTGAAKDQMKYDFEVLPRDHTFDFLMRCEMELDYQHIWEKLLAIGLRLLEMGEMPLGGRLARGVGQVRLENLQVFELDLHDAAALKAMLIGTGENARYGTLAKNSATWVQETIQKL